MRTKTLLLLFCFLLPILGSAETKETQQKETTVIICTGKHSKCYHNKICRGMKNCKGETEKVSLSEAKKIGRTPCGYCYK